MDESPVRIDRQREMLGRLVGADDLAGPLADLLSPLQALLHHVLGHDRLGARPRRGGDFGQAVARYTERADPPAEDAPGGADSPRIASCGICGRALAEEGEAFFVVLDRYTIGDLVEGNRKLRAPSRRTRDGGQVTARVSVRCA